MQYKFKAYGHPNITAKHKTTLEFTKDKELSLRGDCIVGVKSDFELPLIKNFISQLKKNKIKITIEVDDLKEEIIAEVNPDFDSDREMVIRKSEFKDERAFAVRADKSSIELKRELVECMKKPDCIVEIFLDD